MIEYYPAQPHHLQGDGLLVLLTPEYLIIIQYTLWIIMTLTSYQCCSPGLASRSRLRSSV